MSEQLSPVVRGLLDTSVVIALESLAPEQLPEAPAISALTLAEFTSGPLATDDPDERARRQDRLQRVEALLDPLPFDAAAARAYGRVYAATRATERKPRGARAVDLMVASVAIATRLPLFTRNPADFDHLVDVGPDLHTAWRRAPTESPVAVNTLLALPRERLERRLRAAGRPPLGRCSA